MPCVVILTSSFPYEGGEQFLESEIIFWKNTKFKNVYLLPISQNGTIRNYPPNVTLLKKQIDNKKILYICRAIFHGLFFKELLFLIKKKEMKYIFKNLFEAIRSTANLLRIKKYIESAIRDLEEQEIVIYSYWNDVSFYASCMLIEQGIVSKVISRAHRFDLYEEERSHQYMPLKRQFTKYNSLTYLLSESALNYYHCIYKTQKTQLKVSRLGVLTPPSIPVYTFNPNSFNLLSISYCTTVKQIHLIISSLDIYASLNKQTEIKWTHIGSGPLYTKLKGDARAIVAKHSNLKIDFPGGMTNADVCSHLCQNSYDLFINVSRSEGIPVSIMEAMSYGIPAIAPNVGEISELVNNLNGHLLPTKFEINDIVEAFSRILKLNQDFQIRENAMKWVALNFDAEKNYTGFIRDLENQVLHEA